jgi:hypothetical protein
MPAQHDEAVALEVGGESVARAFVVSGHARASSPGSLQRVSTKNRMAVIQSSILLVIVGENPDSIGLGWGLHELVS